MPGLSVLTHYTVTLPMRRTGLQEGLCKVG